MLGKRVNLGFPKGQKKKKLKRKLKFFEGGRSLVERKNRGLKEEFSRVAIE